MSRYIYIARIEGIAGTTGSGAQAALCYPRVPAYAAGVARYHAGLAEPPSGIGAKWDPSYGRVTQGKWSFILRDTRLLTACPWDPWVTRPRPVNELTAAIGAVGAAWPVLYDAATVGMTVGAHYYVGTETIRVAALPGGGIVTVARGQCGSTAVAHPAGADIFPQPPAMVGRAVVIYQVDEATATGIGDEAVIMRGYIASEAAGRSGSVTYECETASMSARLNDEYERVSLGLAVVDGRPSWAWIWAELGAGFWAPRYSTSGGYLYHPDADVVVGVAYSAGPPWTYRFDPTPMWGDLAELAKERPEDRQRAYEIALSDSIYSPYGYNDGVDTASAHPIDIALNHILSTEGGANSSGAVSWDRGLRLAPEHALGVPVAQVPTATWTAVRDGPMAGATTKLWYGGDRRETLGELLERLLAPLGYAVAVTSAGLWLPVALADVYSVALGLTSRHLAQPAEWVQSSVSRPLDRVEIEVDAGPAGGRGVPVVVEETDASARYPRGRGIVVGGTETYRDAPYTSHPFDTTYGWGNRLVARRVRRLADRVAQVECYIGQSAYGLIDVGSSVTLLQAGLLRDPTTGDPLTAASTALRGIVAEYTPDPATRTARIVVLLSDTSDRVGLISPSATVSGYAAGPPPVVSCVADDWSETGDDATTFSAGQVLALLDLRGILRSTVAYATVQSVAALGITLVAAFQDGGGPVAPVATDLVVLADYSASQAAERARYCWSAALAAADAVPEVGAGDPAYEYGD